MDTGRFFRAALVLVMVLMPWRIWASDLISSKAYLEDPTGQLTFDEVRQASFTPYTGILTKGLSSSVFWVRLRIDPALGSGSVDAKAMGGFPPSIYVPDANAETDVQTLALRVRPPTLDQIELFDPFEPHKTNRIAGNHLPWADSEIGSLNHGFVIAADSAPRDVWLRVMSGSTMVIGVDALPYSEMRALDKRQEILNTLDVALTIFFIIWAGLLFAMRPDRLVGAFLVVMVVSFCYATNYMGYYRIFLGDWLPAKTYDTMHSIFVMLLPASYMLFNRRLLQDYQPNATMMRALLPFQYCFVAGWLLLFLGYEQLALSLVATLTFVGQLFVCVILVVGLRAKTGSAASAPNPNEPVLSRYWILAYSLLLALLFSGLILPALGLIEATWLSLYRSIVQGAVPFLLMAVIVHLRNRRLDLEQQRQVAMAEQVAAFEKSRREESEQFLAMLTHEIRTPLTVMAYAAKTDMPEGQLGEHVKSGISEIDELIERCLLADRADQAGLPLRVEQTTLKEILRAPESRFAGARIDWTVNLPGDFVITTDITITDLVINNLIDNALKYSPADARVKVVVKLDNLDNRRGIVFEVSNPPGVAGFPDADRVFLKYYRAPRAHIRTGSGLGLYVARSFTQKLGGQLNYHRTIDCLWFDLWLPL
jgi:signal transduction histidine kinase